MSGYPFGVYTNWSYQHWPGAEVERTPSPGSPVLLLVRSVNTGAPVATSSLRNSLDVGAPLAPSSTYMRVFPFGSVVTAIVGRVVDVGPR